MKFKKSQLEKDYKIYVALLTQGGTDAPVATILENTLSGEIVWTRNVAGQYYGTLTGEFTVDKTLTFITRGIGGTAGSVIWSQAMSVNQISITTTTSGGLYDGGFGGFSQIEIRVYN